MSSRPDNRNKRPARRGLAALLAGLCLAGAAMADPLPWRQYPGVEYVDFELPTDYRAPAEWVFERLALVDRLGRVVAMRRHGWTIDYRAATGTSRRSCAG
jgi:hypothetical protein